jgi:hypothetical protein
VIRVEVHEGSPTPPQQQPFNPVAPRGRGLQMVDWLARSWSWSPDDDGGKIVWALVPPRWPPQP